MEFVSQKYPGNPKEELILDMNQLENGMKVLMGYWNLRMPDGLDLTKDKWWEYSTRRLNRWCVVSKLKQTGTKTYSFIGVYDNGDEMDWEELDTMLFLVKKNSIITSLPGETELLVEKSNFLDRERKGK